MSEGRVRTLLGETIQFRDDYIDIDTLKFLKDNPRVYACTHGLPDFENWTEEEQQDEIFKQLLQEPSVKNLLPEVRRHKGLVEPISVRYDRMEVIEGNSRLAVYRKLRDDKFEGEWQLIPCEIVSSITDEQQAAFLNEVHVKGKTQWSAYEKANFAYVRKAKGWGSDQIAKLFGESHGTIRKRVNVIGATCRIACTSGIFFLRVKRGAGSGADWWTLGPLSDSVELSNNRIRRNDPNGLT